MANKTPDAAFSRKTRDASSGGREMLYFFKQRQYVCWDIASEVSVSGYPRDIQEDWPGLLDVFPGQRITGALHVPEWGDHVYFLLSGQRVTVAWDLATGRLQPDRIPLATLLPATIARDGNFAPVYAEIQNGSRVIYGFRGDEYTRWTVISGRFPAGEDAGFPRKIAPDWKDGLTLAPKCGVHAHWPNRSRAHSNNKIYFFMGNLYLRWDVPSNSRNYRMDIFAGWKNWPEFG